MSNPIEGDRERRASEKIGKSEKEAVGFTQFHLMDISLCKNNAVPADQRVKSSITVA
jgi:hypothetical protein